MSNFRLYLALGACSLILAACGGDEKETAKADAAPVAAVAPGAGPKVTPGLWEEVTTIDGGQTNTLKKCVGDTDADLLAAVRTQSQGACNPTAQQVAGGWQIEVTCNMGTGGTMKSKSTVKGDLSTGYTSEAVNVIEGAQVEQMNRTLKVAVQSKRLGPCPEGMNPGAVDTGDMIIDPSGMAK